MSARSGNGFGCGLRASVLIGSAPQHGERAVAEVAPAGHRDALRILDLPRAAVAAQLLHRLDHVIDAGDVRLGEKAAVGVDRERAAELDAAVLDEVADLAARAEAGLLELEQRDVA